MSSAALRICYVILGTNVAYDPYCSESASSTGSVCVLGPWYRAKPKPGTALPKPYVMPSIVQYLVLTFCTALPGTTGNQCAGYGTLGELRYLPTRTLCNVQ